jgi:XTP/dITP diphosphohydrolase
MMELPLKELVIATHNAGKLREIQALLSPFGILCRSAGELKLPEPDETGFMFCENAALKAHAAAKASGLPALADDSGLCIDALDGAPGLFSANWAGPDKNFDFAMVRIQKELERRGACTPQTRRAHFTCALVLAWPDGRESLSEGRVFGHIAPEPVGPSGFGYDPLFVPEDETRTFGQMSAQEKHGIDWCDSPPRALSHRARAFVQLVNALNLFQQATDMQSEASLRL